MSWMSILTSPLDGASLRHVHYFLGLPNRSTNSHTDEPKEKKMVAIFSGIISEIISQNI